MVQHRHILWDKASRVPTREEAHAGLKPAIFPTTLDQQSSGRYEELILYNIASAKLLVELSVPCHGAATHRPE